MAESQPQHEQTVSGKTIARVCNISERRVHQLAKEGIMPKAEKGRYAFLRCVTGYIQFLQARVDGSGVKMPHIEDSKGRKLAAEAEMAELELAKGRAEVITIGDHLKVINLVFDLLKSGILAMPTRIAPNLVTATDVRSIKSLLEADLAAVLADLSQAVADSSRRLEKGLSEPPAGSKAADAAPETARRRVGRPRKSAVVGSSG
jgi:phage terminase Nu1 subunit (DNA packaging protein)